MKKLIQVSIFLFLAFNSFSQERPPELEQKLDSLWNVWEDESQSDTIRLIALSDFACEGYLYSQPDSAFYFAQLMYDFAQRKGLKKYMGSALNTMGVSFWVRSDYPKALESFQKFLKIIEEIGNKKGVASALANIGLIYTEQGNSPMALDFFQRALKVQEEIGNKTGVAICLNNIGLLYVYQSEFSKALDNFQRSLKIKEELGEQLGIGNAFMNIGLVYGNQSDYPNALKYYHRYLKIMEEFGNKDGIAKALTHIGTIYLLQTEYPQALDYFQRSLKINEEIGRKNGIANSMINIGYINLKQANYPKALEFCETGFKLSVEMKTLERQQEACECLYETYKSMGNNAKALEYFEHLTAVKDSLFNEENTKKMTQLEMQYDFDKKEAATQAEQEKKDALATQELERQKLVRNGFMGGFAVVLLFAGVFFVQRNKIGKEKERSENLLLNILPAEVAEELKEKGESEAKNFDEVSVIFTDFKSFTQTAEKLNAKELVDEINICFKAFDAITEKYGIEKIKTIGDAYMAAGGLNTPRESEAKDVVKAALEMQAFMLEYKAEKLKTGSAAFEMRVGVHTGPVVAGIVGVKKFQYDIWGDTVNTASRMESNGEVGKVNVSEATYNYLKDDPDFVFESRGKINAKGKGEIEMYFVSKS